ncbi:MAG: TRAP transporter TatT component family protein [Oligoflexus sp.]
MAVKQMGPMLSSASPELQKEKSWNFFKTATPGSLQLSEALLSHDPDNVHLLGVLTKGFASYGFVVHDTEHLAERLHEKRPQPAREEAMLAFSKALDFGFRFLNANDVKFEDLQSALREDRIGAVLDKGLDGNDILHQDTVFFTGTAWLLLANYRRDNMVIASQISLAFELIRWTCRHNPNYKAGLCQTMEAVFHLARPPMLGGKPDLAQKMLLEATKKNPHNLLIPVTYMEWYLLPREEEKEYLALKKDVQAKLKKWREQSFIPGVASPEDKGSDLLNLFNAMAEKRLAVIESVEKDLF